MLDDSYQPRETLANFERELERSLRPLLSAGQDQEAADWILLKIRRHEQMFGNASGAWNKVLENVVIYGSLKLFRDLFEAVPQHEILVQERLLWMASVLRMSRQPHAIERLECLVQSATVPKVKERAFRSLAALLHETSQLQLDPQMLASFSRYGFTPDQAAQQLGSVFIDAFHNEEFEELLAKNQISQESLSHLLKQATETSRFRACCILLQKNPELTEAHQAIGINVTMSSIDGHGTAWSSSSRVHYETARLILIAVELQKLGISSEHAAFVAEHHGLSELLKTGSLSDADIRRLVTLRERQLSQNKRL